MHFLLTLLLCAPPLPRPQPSAKRETRLVLWYIPFAVDTSVPVTAETIGVRAHYTVTLESPERIAALTAILADRKPASRFDPNLVRLVVARDSVGPFTIIVDQAGQVLEGPEKSSLSAPAFAALKKMLSELTAGMRLKGSRVVTAQPPPEFGISNSYFLNSESKADRTRP
jgi:hypothetical protein